MGEAGGSGPSEVGGILFPTCRSMGAVSRLIGV